MTDKDTPPLPATGPETCDHSEECICDWRSHAMCCGRRRSYFLRATGEDAAPRTDPWPKTPSGYDWPRCMKPIGPCGLPNGHDGSHAEAAHGAAAPPDRESLTDILDNHLRIEVTGAYGSHLGWECDCGGWDSRNSTIRWSEHVAGIRW